MGGKLTQVDGAAAGAWIEPHLSGFGGRVNQQVPEIFEAYARIFHPAGDEKGDPVTWAEVDRRLGTTAHREMQWHAIVGSWDFDNFEGSRWDGQDPDRSELDEVSLRALCEILALHTQTADDCFFGLSTIHGGVEEAYPEAPVLSQPHRDWAVLHGPISGFDELGARFGQRMRFAWVASAEVEEPIESEEDEPAKPFWSLAPNLIWPEDRTWFVASEYDFDSTLVGGGRELIEAILASPDLEAWEVDPEVSLTCDADEINPVPEAPPPEDPEVGARRLFEAFMTTLSGPIFRAAVDEAGGLRVEVGDEEPMRWDLTASGCDLTPSDPEKLAGLTITEVRLAPDSPVVECVLSDGGTLRVAPHEGSGEDGRSAYRIEPPWGPVLIYGPGYAVEHKEPPE